MPSGDHAVALIALLYLPVAIMGLLTAVEVGARAGLPAAEWLRRGYLESRPTVRLAALGIVISASIHLALAPTHWAEDHVRAVLFALDGIALSGVAVWAMTVRIRPWRATAAALLSAGIVGYLGYVIAGVEQVDAVGVATKLVELAAIGLVLVASGHDSRSEGGWVRQLISLKIHGGLFR